MADLTGPSSPDDHQGADDRPPAPRASSSQRRPSRRSIFGADGPWWGPYLGVLLFAALAGLAVLIVVLANGPEVLRALRGWS